MTPTITQKCSACGKAVAFRVLHVRPIYYGVVVHAECPKGHEVHQHQRSA